MVVRLPDVKKYLNRDGLEEYNSLLPHSSSEIQEYVDDWLDAHPEATTTVQDGSITTQKLADDSVTRNKLAADVAHLLGGMMVTGEVQGEILSADDAYSVAPLSMEIDGKSTQNGTPTPESPIPIQSIEVLELELEMHGANMWGGERLRSDFLAAVPSYTDGIDAVHGAYISGSSLQRTLYLKPIPFEENKRYTMIFAVENLRGNAQTSILIEYTDGSSQAITIAADGSYTVVAYQTLANKTVSHITGINRTVNIRIYYNQCGIFEGVHTVADFQPYVNITANIPMQGHVLRSLPDGTHDTMSLSYLRESNRIGWAWYSRELVQKLHEITLNACTWLFYSATAFYTRGLNLPFTTGNVEVLCNIFKPSASKNLGGLANAEINSIQVLGRNELGIKTASEYQDASAFVASLDDSDVAVAKLATPITTQLDPVELPVLPAPNCTVWSDPTTGLKMSYMRDANIVISNIEQAIADL